MIIDVVRLGDASQLATVQYSCEDGAAVAGINYEAVAGTLQFEVDQTEHAIHVPILDTTHWNATIEFTMHLFGARGAALGLNLHQCRVWIIDKDRFPSSRVSEGSTRFGLLFEYFKHASRNPVVSSGSLKTLAIDQLPNMLFVLQLVLQVQLVDKVLQPVVDAPHGDTKAKAAASALFYGALYALPIFVINWLQLSKCWLGVGGAARKQLQVDILRKYVNLTTQARAQAGRAGFIEAISRYAVEVVDNGYCKIFDSIRSLGKILVLLLWSLTVSYMAFPFMLMLPLISMVRVYTQEAHSTALRLKLYRVQDYVVAHADDVARNFQLIRDYHRRPLQAQRLERVVQEANFFSNAVWDFDTRSALVAPTLANFFAGLLVVASPFLIADSHFTLGEVLAALQAVMSMGDECQLSFQTLVQIQHAVSALLKVTHVLNLPTDVADRLRVGRLRRQMGHEGGEGGEGDENDAVAVTAAVADAIAAAPEPSTTLTKPPTPRFAADLIDIELRSVSLVYPGADDKTLTGVSLKLVQGRVIAVVGAPSSGKATLLRLIAGVLLPTEGQVFSPPHLTLVHVEQQPAIMAMSLQDNLWLGRRTAFNATDLEYVCEVCAAVGLPEDFLATLRASFDDSASGSGPKLPGATPDETALLRDPLERAKQRDVDNLELDQMAHLAQQHAALVHLARALIASPEVLVLHRPLALLDEAIASRMLGVLRAFVRERGLGLDPANRGTRRLRTVIFSCQSLEQALQIADDVVVMGKPRGRATTYTAERLRSDTALRASVAATVTRRDARRDSMRMGGTLAPAAVARAQAALQRSPETAILSA